MLALAIGLGVASAALTAYVVISRDRRQYSERVDEARAHAGLLVKGARLEVTASRRAAETASRARALELREQGEAMVAEAVEALVNREERTAAARDEVDSLHQELNRRRRGLDDRNKQIKAVHKKVEEIRVGAADIRQQEIAELEDRSGSARGDVVESMTQGWRESAQAEAAQIVRAADISPSDPTVSRNAQRLMEIAVGRYQNHFLTERGISNIAIQPRTSELLLEADGSLLSTLQEVANINMFMSEAADSIKLEGLDGVGREVARRALNRINKKPQCHAQVRKEPAEWTRAIRTQLDREIQGLGKKAFSVLEIPKSHPEIVTLVGRLNYRTSYTQNQWLHAVEAAFLAGMMAEEVGLDVSLTRRATLIHDIGKALTHEMDGSHAVIGADIARRLGEDEIVANAIGSHHDDEPANSAYAHLVAAADAMSGARPGARREHTDGYSTKLQDLERIGASYRGVDQCFAVQGGRELRVYVRENEVSDLDAVEMSSAIAEQISEEMTFPGQIKVTVIRATEAEYFAC